MACCTFFGHRDVTCDVKDKLYHVLKILVEKEGVETFLVGNQGGFDAVVRKMLMYLKEEYPHIKYSVVMAYVHTKNRFHIDYSDTVFPEELEEVFPKWAIDKRNRYMISKSSFAVTYVQRSFGGAFKYKRLAEKKGLRVINLAEV